MLMSRAHALKSIIKNMLVDHWSFQASIWKDFTISKPKKLTDLENKIGHLFGAGTMRAKMGLILEFRNGRPVPRETHGLSLEGTPFSGALCPRSPCFSSVSFPCAQQNRTLSRNNWAGSEGRTEFHPESVDSHK